MKEELFESIFNEEMNTAYAVKVPVTKEGKVKTWAKILIALSYLGGTASAKEVYKMVYGKEREGSSQNGPFAAVTREGYMTYDAGDKKLHLTSKGEELIDEYNLLRFDPATDFNPNPDASFDGTGDGGNGHGVEGGVGAGASESHGNLSDERKYDLYNRLIDIFNDINQDGDYDSMEQIITDALDSSDFASNFIARLGKRIASSFGM
jgi:hypothetical protein